MEKLVEVRKKFILGEDIENPERQCVADAVFPDPNCLDRQEWSRYVDALIFTWELQKESDRDILYQVFSHRSQCPMR
jgi:hypothetical protein